jgi:glycosyltransferase involved in cell wall biosynthesis
MPSWDNTARRKDPSIFLGASPQAYQEWLEKLCNFTLKSLPPESQFIFINAWNEWAEGTYLEPDRKYGYAYLNATSRALRKVSNSFKKNEARGKILFISHDASIGGAQSVLLSLLTWIKNNTNIVIKVILIKSGDLAGKFREIADVIILNDITSKTRFSVEVFKEVFDFCNGSPDLIYGNTVVAGKLYPILKNFAVPIITHVHEMQNSIDVYAKDFINSTITHSSHFIACSSAVAENLMQSYQVSLPNITTIYAFIQSETNQIVPDKTKKDLRIKLGLNPDNFIVFGAGLGLFWRKGADLFIEIAAHILKSGITNIKFYWLGEFDNNSSNEIYGSWKNISKRIINYGLEKNIYFLGVKENVKEFFKAGDVFILPSREDPFPLVCLEAAQNKLPVVCFADAGGMPEFVENDAGLVVPFGDTKAMAKAILDLYYHPKLRKQLGERAQVKINERHVVDIAAPQILSCCRKVSTLKPEVSIIVPNYNYAKYLEKRLTSIIYQSFKDFELIILDDGSVDDSLKIIDNFRKYPQVQVHVNRENSGSVFSQWYSGISKAKGELIWIAEADDYSNEYFLEQMLPFFDDPEVVLAYCSSHVVDENDQIFENFYINCGYYNNLPGAKKWNKNYTNIGLVELNDGLAIINTIPNASAVIFRKSNFLKINKEELINFRCGGDWYSYINMIREGYIAYLSKPLNYHRRHKESVVGKSSLTASETISDYFKIHNFIIQHFNVDKSILEQQMNAVLIDLHKLWPELSDDEYSKLYDKASLVKQFELKQGLKQ